MEKDTVVKYKNMATFLNEDLLTKQNVWDNLDQIKTLHLAKLKLFDEMKYTTCSCELKKLAKKVTKIEFELQDAWKFPRDARFHRFWDCPQCECPKLDNEDAYGTEFTLYADNCPIHGNINNCKEK